MRTVALLATLCAFSFTTLTACGGGDKKDPEAVAKGDKKADAKADKKADAKADKKADAKAAEVHFDISKDNSGVLARASSVLETSEKVSADSPVRAHVADLSHHAEKGKSNEEICKYEAGILGKKAPAPEDCALVLEHMRVQLGPEIWQQMETCIMKAKTVEELDACEAAEKEAEGALHAKKHGDGLDKDTCEKLFVHYEKLAMDDAGDQAEVVKSILEDVKADVLTTCQEQGTKKEVECSMKAKNMEELGGCVSTIL